MKVKKFSKGKRQPCFTRSINLCCKQLKTCSTFQSAFNKNTFLIRHNVNWKSSCIIYLTECCLCEKYEYVGKPEYRLNLKINKHRNDIWRTMVHRVTITFKCQFIVSMLTLSLLSLTKLKIGSLLEHREGFWILKFQTLFPQGLKISLNYLQDTTGFIW